MRQHQRVAHPVENKQRLVKEAATSTWRNWSKREEAALIAMEAQLDPTNPTAIIDHLVANSSRSRDAIKKRRHLKSYREAVRVARKAGRNSPISLSSEYESSDE